MAIAIIVVSVVARDVPAPPPKNTNVKVNAFGVDVAVNVPGDHHQKHPLHHLALNHWFGKRLAAAKPQTGNGSGADVGVEDDQHQIVKSSTKNQPPKKNTKVNVNAFGVQVAVDVDGDHPHHQKHPLLHWFGKRSAKKTSMFPGVIGCEDHQKESIEVGLAKYSKKYFYVKSFCSFLKKKS